MSSCSVAESKTEENSKDWILSSARKLLDKWFVIDSVVGEFTVMQESSEVASGGGEVEEEVRHLIRVLMNGVWPVARRACRAASCSFSFAAMCFFEFMGEGLGGYLRFDCLNYGNSKCNKV